MEIKIEDYLSESELKEIVTEEIRKHVRNYVEEVSVSSDKSRVLISQLAKHLAKEGVQEIIPNFTELINEQIQTEIKNLKISNFFDQHTFGWTTKGAKILNEVLHNNKELLDAKIKEIFKIN